MQWLPNLANCISRSNLLEPYIYQSHPHKVIIIQYYSPTPHHHVNLVCNNIDSTTKKEKLNKAVSQCKALKLVGWCKNNGDWNYLWPNQVIKCQVIFIEQLFQEQRVTKTLSTNSTHI